MKNTTNRPDYRADKVWETLNQTVSPFFMCCEEPEELDENLARKMVKLATIIEDEIEMDDALYWERYEVLQKAVQVMKRGSKKTPSRTRSTAKKRVR